MFFSSFRCANEDYDIGEGGTLINTEGKELSATPVVIEIHPIGNNSDGNNSAYIGDGGSNNTANNVTTSDGNTSTSPGGAVPLSVGKSGGFLTSSGSSRGRENDGDVPASE